MEDLVIFAGIIVGVLVLFVVLLVNVWIPFSRERANIKMEIARSHGREREHWKRELKKLYFRWMR